MTITGSEVRYLLFITASFAREVRTMFQFDSFMHDIYIKKGAGVRSVPPKTCLLTY